MWLLGHAGAWAEQRSPHAPRAELGAVPALPRPQAHTPPSPVSTQSHCHFLASRGASHTVFRKPQKALTEIIMT